MCPAGRCPASGQSRGCCFLVLNAGRSDEASALLHRFKAMAATLGAGQLEAASIALEQVLREGGSWREPYRLFAEVFRTQREAVLQALG